MYEIRKHKIDIRKHHLARRAAIPNDVRAARDAKICQNLLSAATYRYADIVLMYYPVKGEVDILPVFRAAIAAGKRVAFPRCHAEDRSMIFYFVESEEDFEDGTYDLREPKETLPAFDPAAAESQNVICIVPAVVYDKRGYRIGYGGGYYDRFFGKHRFASIGVAYDDFILKSVPHGKFDIRADVVISERGYYADK